MNDLDSLRLMVRNYPGGGEAVALRLGKSWSTLDKELRGAPGYKLGVLDASAIASMCLEVGSPHALAWLNAVAVNCGVTVVLPDLAKPASGDPMHLMSAAMRETSDVMQALVEGLADASISKNDKKHVQREITEAIEALQQLMRAVDAAASKAVRHA